MRERIISLFFIGFILLISSFCGCVDNDSDGDSYANDVDVFPDDPFEWKDSDNDGVGDNSDEFPNNPYEQIDSDKDGVGNNDDDFPYDSTQWVDRDNDSYGDNPNGINYDKFPDDPLEWNDTDNDGVGDNSDFYPTGNALIEVYISNYKYQGYYYDPNSPIQFFIEIIGINGVVIDNWDLLDTFVSDFFYDQTLIDPVIYIFDIDDSYESFKIIVSVKLMTSPSTREIDIDFSSFSEVQEIIFEPQINDYIWINDIGDISDSNYIAQINFRIRIKY